MPRVLIADDLSLRAAEILRESGKEVDVRTALSPEALEKTNADYDGVAVRSATKITAPINGSGKRRNVNRRAGN